jgi:D-arabinose 1-dehydrogenase-like Zn-dependent alcohol dehydrogenase
MKSYVLTEFGKKLQTVETPTPAPRGTQVLLKTLAAGVCHSDLHIWDGYFDMGGGKRQPVADTGIATPLTLGHEIAGEVAAIGPEAKGVKPGEIFVAYPWIGCGECSACGSGRENICGGAARTLGIRAPGGYADYVLVPHPRYLAPLGELSPVNAAPYACSGLTSYAALQAIGAAVYQTQPILVIGAGGLGLTCLKQLKALGGKGAVAADTDPKKREAALAAGALASIDPNAEKPGSAAIAAAGGPIAAAIDFVGDESTARLGISAVARGGKLVIAGLFGGSITLPLPMLPFRALAIQGVLAGTLAEFKELVALAAQGKIESVPLVERPLAEADKTMRDLRAGSIVGRAVLRP